MIKLKKDVFKLIKLKKEKCNNFDSIKEKMLRENYNLLEKCLENYLLLLTREYFSSL